MSIGAFGGGLKVGAGIAPVTIYYNQREVIPEPFRPFADFIAITASLYCIGDGLVDLWKVNYSERVETKLTSIKNSLASLLNK